jgi:hypothetical protein
MACSRKLTFFAALAGAVVLPLVSSLAVQAGDDRWQWAYCAPPYPPACVGARVKEPKARTSCEQDAEAYVADVFKYRDCLTKEMERAVREANKVIQTLKCPKDARFCYDTLPGRPSPE